MRIFLLCLCLSLHAKIVEFAHFNELSSFAKEETLFVLDIDDTILVPVQMLGCDEWFQYRWKLHQEEGTEKKVALEKALAEWEAVRHITKMEIVEAGTEEVIQEMQKKKYCIMGLTTQGLALATRTSLQLLEQQINLSTTAPCKEDCYFQIDGHGILFRNGILFTSGKHKGKALLQFLEQDGCRFKRIVFINDKASHLTEVEGMAEKQEIEFIGLRYSYSDARKRAFCPEIAEYQFSHSSFAHLISDEEARETVMDF